MNHQIAVSIDDATSGLMDSLRGISALIVASVHAFQIFALPYIGLGTAGHVTTTLLATYAVLVFFVVSGFMIHVSMQRHRTADGHFQSWAFARARILRIYPPLLAAVAMTLLIWAAIHLLGLHGAESYRLGGELFVARERAALDWPTLASTIFLIYGAVPNAPLPLSMNGPLWTLSYEWWFYILTFLVARLWNGRTLSIVLPIVAVLAMLLYGRNPLFLYFLMIWLFGFVLGHFYLTRRIYGSRYWLLIALLALAALASIMAIGREHVVRDVLNPYDTPAAQKIMVCVGLLITISVSILIRCRYPSSKGTLVPKLADFSYTLYIVHYPLLLFGFSLLHPALHGYGWPVSLVVSQCVLVAVVYVAFLLARVVENRVLLARLLNAVSFTATGKTPADVVRRHP